jgi:hypothetical protein
MTVPSNISPNSGQGITDLRVSNSIKELNGEFLHQATGKINGRDVHVEVRTNSQITPSDVIQLLKNATVNKVKTDSSGTTKAELRAQIKGVKIYLESTKDDNAEVGGVLRQAKSNKTTLDGSSRKTENAVSQTFKNLQNKVGKALEEEVLNPLQNTYEKTKRSADEILGNVQFSIRRATSERPVPRRWAPSEFGKRESVLNELQSKAARNLRNSKEGLAKNVNSGKDWIARQKQKLSSTPGAQVETVQKTGKFHDDQYHVLKDFLDPANAAKYKNNTLDINNKGELVVIEGKKTQSDKALVLKQVLWALGVIIKEDVNRSKEPAERQSFSILEKLHNDRKILDQLESNKTFAKFIAGDRTVQQELFLLRRTLSEAGEL